MKDAIKKIANYMVENKIHDFENRKEAVEDATFWYDAISSIENSLSEKDKYNVYVEFEKNPPEDEEIYKVAFHDIAIVYLQLAKSIDSYERKRNNYSEKFKELMQTFQD